MPAWEQAIKRAATKGRKGWGVREKRGRVVVEYRGGGKTESVFLPQPITYSEQYEDDICAWLRDLYKAWNNGKVTLAVAMETVAPTSDKVGSTFGASWQEIRDSLKARKMTWGRRIQLKSWEDNYERFINHAIDQIRRHNPSDGKSLLLLSAKNASGYGSGAPAGTGKPGVYCKIKNKGKVWAEALTDKVIELVQASPRDAVSIALIGDGGVSKSVAKHPGPCLQRRHNGFHQMVSPGCKMQQGLGFCIPSIRSALHQEFSDLLGPGGPSGLAGLENRLTDFHEICRQPFNLRGFTGTLATLKCDKFCRDGITHPLSPHKINLMAAPSRENKPNCITSLPAYRGIPCV